MPITSAFVLQEWKSRSLRAIPQLSIQLTKLDVFSQPPGTYGAERLDT